MQMAPEPVFWFWWELVHCLATSSDIPQEKQDIVDDIDDGCDGQGP